MKAINDAVVLKTQLIASLALTTVVLIITPCSCKLVSARHNYYFNFTKQQVRN